MLAKVLSCAVVGLEGAIVEVEVDIAAGLPAFTIVGLPDTAVQEAKERVRAAIRNSGLTFPVKRITVNLALNRRKQERRRLEREATLSASPALLAGDRQDSFAMVDQPAHIERALHELPTLQRSVIILRHMNGLSTKQVSSILGCSEGTVKTHLHRALKKLRSRLHYLVEDAPQ